MPAHFIHQHCSGDGEVVAAAPEVGAQHALELEVAAALAVTVAFRKQPPPLHRHRGRRGAQRLP